MDELFNALMGGSSKQLSQSDRLVQSYKATQQSRVDALTTKKRSLEKQQVFYNSLKSKVDGLVSQLDKFTASNANEKFITRSVVSSNEDAVTATANGDAYLTTNSVKVNRLASNDALFSAQIALDGNDLNSLNAGDYSFDLSVGGNTSTINVNLTGSETNEEILSKIATAVNDAEDLNITASVIKDTSSTARLSLNSINSGSENQIEFSNSNLLKKLGLDNSVLKNNGERKQLSGADAGYTMSSAEMLDAELVINGGLTVTRSSNSIDDLFEGVSLTLNKAQEAGDMAVTLKTDVGTSEVVSLIKPLLDKYNELFKYVNADKSMRRGDMGVSTLTYRLRSVSTQTITSVSSGDLKYLSSIGISINNDGTLIIEDEALLEENLKENPEAVAELFTSSDGFVSKLNNAIANLVGDDGLIKSRTSSLGQQIDQNVKRTEQLESRIDRQAEALRKEYESMLEIMLEAQNQYSFLGSSGSGSYY